MLTLSASLLANIDAHARHRSVALALCANEKRAAGACIWQPPSNGIHSGTPAGTELFGEFSGAVGGERGRRSRLRVSTGSRSSMARESTSSTWLQAATLSHHLYIC
jgi:hypothetical protein